MSERRMFAKTIVFSDAFLDMPMSTRNLYFSLNMVADDDGFVNQPKTVMRMIGSSQDDLMILITKKFIIPFESGVVVIKHWKIHNYIQNDRKHQTKYLEELSTLGLDENNAYKSLDTVRIQSVYEMDSEVRLGKDRLGESSLGKEDISSLQIDKSIPNNQKTFEKDAKPYKCAEYLCKRILERIPEKNIPERTVQSWASDFDKLNRLDGHPFSKIAEVLDFSQTDIFWSTNILSGKKFREKYDQLRLKMEQVI